MKLAAKPASLPTRPLGGLSDWRIKYRKGIEGQLNNRVVTRSLGDRRYWWCPSLGSMMIASELTRRRGHSEYDSPCGIQHSSWKYGESERQLRLATETFPAAVLEEATKKPQVVKDAVAIVNRRFSAPSGKEEAMRLKTIRAHYHITNEGHYITAFGNNVWIAEKPSTIKKRGASFHSENGPALAWKDGFELYFINGVLVPKNLIMDPKNLSTNDILNQRNAEVVRVMLEKMGIDTFMKRTGGKITDQDKVTSTTMVKQKDGTFVKGEFEDIRKLIRIDTPRLPDRVVQLLLVECPSTGHKALLGVPPTVTGVQRAVDWVETKPATHEFVLET